jgi:hypothetical protein
VIKEVKIVKARVKVYSLICTAFFLFIFSSQENCIAQYLAGFSDIPHRNIDNLLKTLKSGKMSAVPEVFFGDLYDPNLVDLIIFLDEDEDTVKIEMIQGNECKPYLFGARHFWVMAFWKFKGSAEFDSILKSEPETTQVIIMSPLQDSLSGKADTLRSITMKDIFPAYVKETIKQDTLVVKKDSVKIYVETKKISKTKTSMEVRLERLNKRVGAGEKILSSLARTVSGAIGVTLEAAAKQDTLPDLSIDFPLIRLTPENSGEVLYYGNIKLPLEENTINRVRVKRFGEKSVYSTFGNYSPSYLGASICAAFNFKDDVRASRKTMTMKNLEVEPFILAHIYLLRPKLPRMKVPDGACRESCFYKSLGPLRPLSITTGFKIKTEGLLNRSCRIYAWS